MKKITYLYFIIFSILFLNISTSIASNVKFDEFNNSQIQRVRLDFKMPDGFVRHLLLGFTTDNSATDGVDYGYDTPTYDNFPDDLNWIIENERFVIQGVGEFNENKQYPLGMFLTNSGLIEISLTSLENFESTINVYLYDSLLETYTLINDTAFSNEFASGEYLNRFYIVFNNPNDENSGDENILSVDDQSKPIVNLKHVRNINELQISANSLIEKIEIYNLLGKKIITKQNIHSLEIKLKIYHINSPYGLVRIYTQSGIITKKIIL